MEFLVPTFEISSKPLKLLKKLFGMTSGTSLPSPPRTPETLPDLEQLARDRLYTRGVLGAVLGGGGSWGDLGRASLQGGSQEFGGERGERFWKAFGRIFNDFLRFWLDFEG